MRRCTGCGEHFAKSTLIRVLRTPEGEIVLELEKGFKMSDKVIRFSKVQVAN